MTEKRRVGIVGFGVLGQFLVQEIIKSSDLELAFVWNRSETALVGKIEQQYILDDLIYAKKRNPDIIVEVAHPTISKVYGAEFLEYADYMVGSPTAMADQETNDKLIAAANKHGLYIPSGALWGAGDIKKMADSGSLQAMKVTMKKHPSCFKLNSPLKEKNDGVADQKTLLFEGSIRDLCPLAPNNVNTMAAAAIAGHNIGFDKAIGCLISDPSLTDWHIVEVDAWGPGNINDGKAFHVQTIRKNPAKLGAVTGSATYLSFFRSLLGAKGQGPGLHFC